MVTGGTGFVGSHTLAALHAAGHKVTLLARSVERANRMLDARAIDRGDVTIVAGDILDIEAVSDSLTGCEAVVHAAAVVGIDGAKAEQARATNERGARNVLGAAVDLGLDPIVYISSISALFHPGGPVLLTAHTPVAPAMGPYAASKAACERYARELQAGGAPVVCVYPGGVLGPDDPSGSEAMRGAIIWRRLTMIRLDSGYLLVDVRDIADVITAALTAGKGPRRYLAGHHYVPWSELCDLVAEVTGREVHRLPMTGPILRGLGRGGDVVRKVIPFTLPLSREAMEAASLMVPMDDQATIDELGIEFRSPRETLRDAYRWLYESGRIPARLVPALAIAGNYARSGVGRAR
ncbi:MAG TPA: NAD-dependent epimerase/dehydratase family protein [Frankiaceae bacterium]|jgi:nucleoside-diphosphate-sugar epimerase|nr:NAD-dependent epimerase/dehydratase family protein [Frankiaceae bacterium]